MSLGRKLLLTDRFTHFLQLTHHLVQDSCHILIRDWALWTLATVLLLESLLAAGLVVVKLLVIIILLFTILGDGRRGGG